jgi:glutamate/aspartate transport system substrate-binding protein
MFVAFSFANAFAQDVGSSPVLKRIKERGQINMGHREASVPFSYMNDEGKPQGYSVDICHRIIDEVKKVVGNSNLKINYVGLH